MNWKAYSLISSLVVGAALLGGCASDKGAEKEEPTAGMPEIKDEWLARVPPDQMGNVEQARAQSRMAQDEATRAKVDVSDAENEHKVAVAERDAEKANVEAAKKALDAAQATGDAARIDQARAEHDRATMKHQVAEEHVEVADARIEAAKTRQKLAEARVDEQKVMVEQSEFQALRAMGDTRVRDMDPTQFEVALAESRAKQSKLEDQLRGDEDKISTAEQKLEQTRQQMQAQQPMEQPAG